MKTIILSGGLGYRLKEETEFKPKPMVLIGGKPILWHIMKIYAHYGFNDFIIALGYKGDQIRQYFLNQKYYLNNFSISTKTGSTHIHKKAKDDDKNDDFKITFVDTGEETLPGERILRTKDFIPPNDKYFMVTYGDGVADIDIKKLVSFHKKQGTIGTVTGVHPRSKYGLLRINEKHIAEDFVEKPVLKERTNGGFMVFKKDFFNYINPAEFEHEALKRLVAERQLSVYAHDGFWHSMDTYTDVDDLNKIWREDPKWNVWR
ncbi:MAG: sugar phosphate nucleotidyltransferase [Actinobacteria bacterium]|nr:sugar phosphate nucleotidyltransferase [Actinomycetota bacterium]